MTRDGIKRALDWLTGLFLVHALLLSVYKFLTPRSLWLDEAFVACNVRFRDLGALFSPLEYAQQFPRVYLALVWVLTKLIGYETGVLRFMPFLFGIGALLLWSKILWDEFPTSPLLRTTAVLAFLVNHVFYQYVGDFKQYTGDLFWAGYGVWFAQRYLTTTLTRSFRQWAVLCALGSLPIFFSNTYILVLGAVGVVYVLPTKNERQILLAGIITGIIFGINYATDLRYAPPSMQDYWRMSFIHGSTLREWTLSFLSANTRLFGEWLLYKWRWVFTILAMMGLFAGRKKRPLIIVTGVLTLELLILAATQRYPIDGERLVLFFYPFSVLAVFHGIKIGIESPRPWAKGLAYGFLGIFLGWILFRKTPELTKQVYRGKHWEDINPAVGLLDEKQATHVVYGSASIAQVRAYPHLPSGFTFHAHPDLDLRSNWLAGPFYYLMATPNEEPSQLLEQLKKQTPHQLESLDKHLFLFRPIENRAIQSSDPL